MGTTPVCPSAIGHLPLAIPFGVVMRAITILNPTAGRRSPLDDPRKTLARSLAKHGISSEIVLTEKAGDAFDLARQAAEHGFDVVIACGGDGTVNEVANGLAGSSTALGVVPIGTVNVLARELGIPLKTREAIRAVAGGVPKPIDLGCADGRYFTLMAGFGFDAEVVSNVVQPIKDWIGPSAYVLKVLETLAKYRATDITLEMPRETYSTKAFLVIVANASTYAYNMKITPDASLDDGLLDICVFERPITDRIGFVGQVADIFTHRHLYHREVRCFRTEHVRVHSEPEVLVQLDGDAFGSTPVEIKIAKSALNVIVPRG